MMVNTVLDSAEAEGAAVERVILRDYRIEYCTGCDACHQNGGRCIKDDDMKIIYPKLERANVIVIGSPNYFKNVSALTKNFMDRTNAFVRVKPRKLEGKAAIGLSVGGEELEDTQFCEDALSRFFKAHRLKIVTMVKAQGDEVGALQENKELTDKLQILGKKIAVNSPKGISFR
jgi:multimeric flavodoxin WrbA